ncbi:MAG: transcription antitermination factor NusB [Armatimonadota bacterium]|nr:MAG: transcription antitermination factor NusB [Armatimonadota bacterium]
MSKRRAAREQALKWLYQIDVGKTPVDQAIVEAYGRLDEAGVEFARELVRGVVAHVTEIDELIARYAKDWSLDRMAAVDRNVLRLAMFEILHLPDIPHGVSADEAVELAKKYSTAESSKFVNGVLGSLLRDLGERQAEPQPQPENDR